MVNNIAANVLGGKPELEDGAQIEGIHTFLLKTHFITVFFLTLGFSVGILN